MLRTVGKDGESHVVKLALGTGHSFITSFWKCGKGGAAFLDNDASCMPEFVELGDERGG